MLLGCALNAPVQAEWHFHRFESMTTNVELEFWLPEGASPKPAQTAVESVFARVNQVMNRYDPESELSQLNAHADFHPRAVSPELYFVLEQASAISGKTAGAFDITFGSVGYLYDYRKGIQPGASKLKEKRKLVDYRSVELDAGRVRYKKPGVMVDLGGIAKGYAVDQSIQVFKEQGIEAARVSAGGDMRLLGSRKGLPWVIGVKDPRQTDQQAVRLPLENVAISTSGDYERFFFDDKGKRIHHILSPETGRPANGIQSVTIIGPTALETDGLSTGVFVMGVEKGLALINRLPDIDAIIIDAQRKMHYSDGLMSPE